MVTTAHRLQINRSFFQFRGVCFLCIASLLLFSVTFCALTLEHFPRKPLEKIIDGVTTKK